MEEVREPQQPASDLLREFIRLRVERVDLLREGRGLLAELLRRLPCFLRVRDVARDFVPSPPKAVRLGERLAPFRVPPNNIVEELRLLRSVALRAIAADDVRTLSNEADVQHDGLDGEDPICRLFGDARRPDSMWDDALLSRRHRDSEDDFHARLLALPAVVGLDQLPGRRSHRAPS